MKKLIKERVIIGGAPSTGSSLLRRLLNRHSEIYSGEETHIFSKLDLYEHWLLAKKRIFLRAFFGLRTYGWHNYTGLNLIGPESDWDRDSLHHLIAQSKTLQEFTDGYFYRMLESTGKSVYADKTPANVFLAGHFVAQLKGKVILTTRHPLDTIGSMVERGNSVYYSVASCLLHNSFLIRNMKELDCFLLKYEDLVTNPEMALTDICEFLNLEFEHDMLLPAIGQDGSVSKMKGWNYDETEGIGGHSMNRFQNLDEESKAKIEFAIQRIKIKDSFCVSNNLNTQTILELIPSLGYSHEILKSRGEEYNIRLEYFKDLITRTVKLYPYNLVNYPMELI